MTYPRRSRLPSILFWIAFLLVLLLIGPIGYALVSLDSRPGGAGADWPAKLLVLFVVVAAAWIAAFAVRLAAAPPDRGVATARLNPR